MHADTDGLRHDCDRPSQSDQLHYLTGVPHHRPARLAHLSGAPLRPTRERLAAQFRHPDALPPGQRMLLRQHHHLPFGQQRLGIEAGKIILRAVQ